MKSLCRPQKWIEVEREKSPYSGAEIKEGGMSHDALMTL